MSSNLEPMKRGLTQWLSKGNNHALLPDLMESVPSQKTLEFEELRAQYELVALKIHKKSSPRRKAEVVIEKTLKDFLGKCKKVLRDAFVFQGWERTWKPPNIDHAVKVITLTKDPQLKEAATAWKDLIGRMEASLQRIVIFREEREAALYAQYGSENARYRANEQLRAKENVGVSENIINTAAENLNKDALELLQRIGEVLEKIIPDPSGCDR